MPTTRSNISAKVGFHVNHGHQPEEALGSDADDRHGMPIHVSGFADDARIAAKTCLQVAIAQHNNAVILGGLAGPRNRADGLTGRRCYTPRSDSLRQRRVFPDAWHSTLPWTIHPSLGRKYSWLRSGHVGEYGARLIAQLTKLGPGELRIEMRRIAGKREICKIERMLNGERPDHQRVNHAEDGCVGADAKRERYDCHRTQPRRL